MFAVMLEKVGTAKQFKPLACPESPMMA